MPGQPCGALHSTVGSLHFGACVHSIPPSARAAAQHIIMRGIGVPLRPRRSASPRHAAQPHGLELSALTTLVMLLVDSLDILRCP